MKNDWSILFKNIAKVWFKNKFILQFPEVVSLVKITHLYLDISFWYLFS